ncbi:MAG: hypothetical protein HC899_38330 [Leptolyngbyaceae cyanobacterium SM1_4_3]|nr:hypothetical protein [Leptolyngbyaceae cyanobacterium SM1_4_3]
MSVGYIIHGAATAAGAVGAGMAQIPGSDNAVITPIQVAMIMAIGQYHNKNIEDAAALSILSSVSAGVVGRTASQIIVGWIPGIGNTINAITAASITEAIGWAANKLLSSED